MTKITAWLLNDYDKMIFLDANTLVLKPCDELFNYSELSAVPDNHWPDIFNSGVFVLEPNEQTYHELLSLSMESGSFDLADQGLLNTYFSDWFLDRDKHLPGIYNCGTLASWSDCYGYQRLV